MPLTEIWDETGPVAARRTRYLLASDFREMLRSNEVQFVVADIGHPLKWVPKQDTFRFWKFEVKPRIADPQGGAILEKFPGEYCYFASEWIAANDSRFVVLERCH